MRRRYYPAKLKSIDDAVEKSMNNGPTRQDGAGKQRESSQVDEVFRLFVKKSRNGGFLVLSSIRQEWWFFLADYVHEEGTIPVGVFVIDDVEHAGDAYHGDVYE
jgi:hypothetical protein